MALPELLREPPLRAILRLATPTTGVMFMATTSNILHAYFVSRLGPSAIAAVSLVFPISLILLTVAGGGIGAGVSSAVARALGSGRIDEATTIAEHALLLNVGLALGLTLILELLANPLFAAMGGDAEVVPQATLFARILFGGLVCPFVVAALDSILRGEGNVRVPAMWSTVSLVLQIALTPLFMFTWRLGLAGAPLATLTGQLIAAVPRAAYVLRGRGTVHPRLWPRHLSLRPIREIVRVGVPASLAAGTNYAAIMLLTTVFARYGTAHLAAYGLCTRLDFLLFTLGYGVAAAALTLVGMSVGAGQPRLAVRYVIRAVFVAAALVLAPAAFFVIRPDAWLGLFTDDAAIIEIGAQYLRIVGPTYLFTCSAMVLASAFQGFGRATAPLIVMLVRVTAVVLGVLAVTKIFRQEASLAFAVIAAGNIAGVLSLSILFRRLIRPARSSLAASAIGVSLAFLVTGLPARVQADESRFFFSGDGQIEMSHAHFEKERLSVRYRDSSGAYDSAALATIARFFRSRESGEVGDVSLRLIELIDYVQDRYRPSKTVLISGYRSPALNQQLRTGGAAVAESSLHTEGIAADLHFEGVDLKRLWIGLREAKVGGVGYYAGQGFLHLDTGRARFWEPQTSRVGERISAGNARVFARTDFDRYASLRGAVLQLHSVTAVPLRIARTAAIGSERVALAPFDADTAIGDDCIVLAGSLAHRLRIVEMDSPSTKQRAPIAIDTCEPRIEATPKRIESNLVELAP